MDVSISNDPFAPDVPAAQVDEPAEPAPVDVPVDTPVDTPDPSPPAESAGPTEAPESTPTEEDEHELPAE